MRRPHGGLTTAVFGTICLVLIADLAASQRGQSGQQSQACPARCNSCQQGRVDCISSSLVVPPRSFPANTTMIDLRNNRIRLVGVRTFQPLSTLEILKLNNNKITALRDNAFQSMPNLATLDLSANRIARIHSNAFNGMTSLRTLLLQQNKIRNVHHFFRGVQLGNLYQLNLASNRINTLNNQDLTELTGVGHLDMRSNRLNRVHPQSFDGMDRLRYLFLNNMPMTRRLPILQFSTQIMRMVDISSSRQRSVPKNFPATLSDMRLNDNRITQVNSSDFSTIQNLQLLNLNDNQLRFFADGSLAHLSRLKEVWLRRNRLVYIPRQLPDSLEQLHMDSNNVQRIEADLFTNQSHLTSLTVSRNRIRSLLPDTFAGLNRLETLDLRGNQLQTLGVNSFRNLPALRDLKLSNNPLARVDAGAFGNLGALAELGLSYISQEECEMNQNFLPEMPALTRLSMMASPSVAEAFLQIIDALPDPSALTMNGVVTLDLSYNTFEYMTPKVRAVFPNVRSLPLDTNPFRCTARLRWLQGWMAEDLVSFSKSSEPKCETPPDLYLRDVISVQSDEWGSDSADRSQEVFSAQQVDEAMARDMAHDPAYLKIERFETNIDDGNDDDRTVPRRASSSSSRRRDDDSNKSPISSGKGKGRGSRRKKGEKKKNMKEALEKSRKGNDEKKDDSKGREEVQKSSVSRDRTGSQVEVNNNNNNKKIRVGAQAPKKTKNLLEERASREERRKKKLRSRGKKGGSRKKGRKGKKRRNRRRGDRKGKKRVKKGRSRSRKHKKGGKTPTKSRPKREVVEEEDASYHIIVE